MYISTSYLRSFANECKYEDIKLKKEFEVQ